MLHLGEEERLRLCQLITGLFAPPRVTWYAGDLGGAELRALDELLKDRIDRLAFLSPSERSLPPERFIQNFIVTAEADELLTLLESMPVAQMKAAAEGERAASSSAGTIDRVATVVQALNGFLAEIGAPARFTSDGKLHREGFAAETRPILSQLPDRSALIADLRSLLHDGTVLGLVLGDLDNFALVHAHHGAKTCVQCLEEVVRVVGQAVAGKGKVYLHAGDKFAVVLRNFQSAEALATAERMRVAVAAVQGPAQITITASFGVAASDQPDLNKADHLVTAADHAVYASKFLGRNRVTAWPLAPDLLEAARRRPQKTIDGW